MKKTLFTGCGGAPSEGVVNSLLLANDGEEIVGMGSEPTDLILSKARKKYIVPYANSEGYKEALFKVLERERPDFMHCQNDKEIFVVSQLRDEIEGLGVKLFLPKHEVIDTCVHKYKSYLKWKEAGIKVPETLLISNPSDLQYAFKHLGNSEGKVWLRSISISGGGTGALPTNDYEFAKHWIDRFDGWGKFSAAELLSSDTVTWLSIWHEGELVVAQTRVRQGWVHGNRTLSNVTGVTKVGKTYSDDTVNKVSLETIKAIDDKPNGIYGVDMTYDFNGYPNPTEINIARFFTTVLFFTKAGLNMPKIYKDIALYNQYPQLSRKINPLPDGLMWMRGMDTEPKLVTDDDMIAALEMIQR